MGDRFAAVAASAMLRRRRAAFRPRRPVSLLLDRLLLAVLPPRLALTAKARTAAIIEVFALLAFANVEVGSSVVGWCRRSRNWVPKLNATGCRFFCEPALSKLEAWGAGPVNVDNQLKIPKSHSQEGRG